MWMGAAPPPTAPARSRRQRPHALSSQQRAMVSSLLVDALGGPTKALIELYTPASAPDFPAAVTKHFSDVFQADGAFHQVGPHASRPAQAGPPMLTAGTRTRRSRSSTRSTRQSTSRTGRSCASGRWSRTRPPGPSSSSLHCPTAAPAAGESTSSPRPTRPRRP
jgi:hypothetical protein